MLLSRDLDREGRVRVLSVVGLVVVGAPVTASVGDPVSATVLAVVATVLAVAATVLAVASAVVAAADAGVIVGGENRRFVSVGSGTLGCAARLLPGRTGPRYLEEWRGELYDRRADGERWWRRAGYVAGIVLYAVPILAVTLRLNRVRAVD